ncbi:L-lysine exporter family protein LysE/ArgO [Nicoletella semolina]|uniref:L-lysine exporter family protein LysE/ArgO n=1 Tax=Nicoletella semolina TaxID=271160 RepID=A0A4R2NAI8_9PAST|nr:LysE/ArgO family amino acid transporter [Nicoletella semolina]MDH2923995.1 amino acid transporter [Nicoletella semolina]TCP18129.1 L-lysine exporter family protein LysE/ArgO [Nicoletella semolina]
MATFFQGFIVSFGLIVSIGAQNAFILKQAILKQHIFWVVFICFACDIILMGVGVLGLGTLLSQSSLATLLLSLCGAIFLLAYGSRSFISAYRGNYELMSVEKNKQTSLKKTILITFAITLLNPHVYIDTIVIVGGIGSTLSFDQKVFFLLGALACSFTWFFGLGYGAGFLTPYFKKKRTWQILDILTGFFMYFIAGSLFIYSAKLSGQIF